MAAECPFAYMNRAADKPTQLNLNVLNPTHHLDNYSYAKEFQKLNLDKVKKDLIDVLTTSQDWWPADYGHYGPLMIRLAWHSAGTYRVHDGRGGANTGNMRFSPLNSWPDNGNLDKARRLLWPIKKKYGRKLSWGDLMIFAGNCAYESMGLKMFGFAGGRVDIWEPESDVYWGPESVMLASERYTGDRVLEKPLGAVQMGLIYVNPEGPDGKPDPLASARDIRETFGRMAMNDEETVALIAGGHTVGKAHGAAPPDGVVGPAPNEGSIEQLGIGWVNKHGTGKGLHAITSGLEGAWTENPAKWDHGYFDTLFKYEWVLGKGAGGANQWYPKDGGGKDTVPDAHDPNKKHPPTMFTTDVALKMDPIYGPISKRFHENPQEFEVAFTKAWYKLCHRDMGPHVRCLGKLVPEEQIWQDPCGKQEGKVIGEEQVAQLKKKILGAGISATQLIQTAWASASTFRQTDYRGGANGAHIRFAPQKDWKVNKPEELAKVLEALTTIQEKWNTSHKPVSLADLIVLGGCVGVEQAAKKGGHDLSVSFTPGRTDVAEEQIDKASFDVLEPTSDGFRNYNSTPHQLVDRAHMLSLTAPEMAVLVAGLRVLGVSEGDTGVLTKEVGQLSNAFFINLLDMSTKWSVSGSNASIYEGKDAAGVVTWTATAVDLVFGSNAELRAIAEHYAQDDSKALFARDFARAWAKVMNLDRFDLGVRSGPTKGKGKGKGKAAAPGLKGKGKGAGSSLKGKSKGKGKSIGKGKSKGKGKSVGKGKSKGKGKSSTKGYNSYSSSYGGWYGY